MAPNRFVKILHSIRTEDEFLAQDTSRGPTGVVRSVEVSCKSADDLVTVADWL
jgi:hypothetical protein